MNSLIARVVVPMDRPCAIESKIGVSDLGKFGDALEQKDASVRLGTVVVSDSFVSLLLLLLGGDSSGRGR